MKVFAFTDPHGDETALALGKERSQEHDLVICTGDLTIFEHEIEQLLAVVDGFGKPVLMLHGNHEEEGVMRALCAETRNVRFLHREMETINGFHFVAYGGGGFDEIYPDFEEWLKEPQWDQHDWSRTILLSHAPPFGTTLDDVGTADESWHVGSHSLRKVIKKRKPMLVLAGHIHDCFYAEDRIGSTLIVNPGPSGRSFTLPITHK